MATMEPGPQRNYRGARTNGHVHGEGGTSARRAHHGNRRWVADGHTGRSGTSTPHAAGDTERWERGGGRGSGRGRGRSSRGKFGNSSVTFRRNGALDMGAAGSEGEHSEMEEEHEVEDVDLNEPDTPEEREKFWQELVKAREVERKRAISEGKMDDPVKPKRLEDAITMVGTCADMCPRFERYRRERENHLFEWETIPGTKRVDHRRAVKAYERAAGDKTLPSDLRPPDVLKHTLDYLFHDLLPHGGFSETFNFIRDRSRAVRNDFTMQHEMGPIAIECHDRCARFHILAIHIERDNPRVSIAMEEQQLMNTLQSLKEFYEEQRGHYQSPTELEMRVYHRLIHIRDQRERHDDIPQTLLNHPVFELTTKFRARVQTKSAPISKTSPLVVDAEAMHIFAELADVLRREGNVVMTYLVACILERHFGKDTIEDIEIIRGDLSLSDIIDGYSGMEPREQDTDIDISVEDEPEDKAESSAEAPREPSKPLQPSGTQWLTDNFGPRPTQSAFFKSVSVDPPAQPFTMPTQSAFSNLKTTPNAFGTASFGTQSPLVNTGTSAAPTSVLGSVKDGANVFALSKDDGTLALSSVSPRVMESSGAPSTSLVSSFPHFGPTPAVAQLTAFTSQADHKPMASPSQTNGSTFGGAKKLTFGSETSPTKTANAFAPALTLTYPVAASASSNVVTSAFNVPASSAVHSFAECPTPSATEHISEPVISMPQEPQQARESSIFVVTPSETPFVSSPPPIDSIPLEDGIDQVPPSQPPVLTRYKPISLPPTPTATVHVPTSLSRTRKSIFGSLDTLQTTPLSAVPTEILSPLVLHSPASKSLLSMPSLRKESLQSPLKVAVSAADIEADARQPTTDALSTSLATGPPPPAKKPSLDIMKATALHFARRSWLVKQTFTTWKQRLDDHAKWIEACQRSTRYKEKIQAERLSRSVGSSRTPNSHAHRKTPSETRVPLKKRLRERLSGEYRPPASDKELARRFEKNHEDHARRWARGSFLAILKSFLASTKGTPPGDWSAWLSLNQESDGTAIWLEQKFNVPDSGEWKNEHVFQMPVTKEPVELAHSYPGIILFECTPLTGVTDLLGRKYRVLEDCTRLREVADAFPADRHYVPSLICIAWNERDPDSCKDFDDMVQSMVEGGMLTSNHELVISTAALDMESKLEEVLGAIPFDLEGQLVKRVSLNDLFKIWEHPWEETTTRWLSNCVVLGEFNWDLYSRLLEGCTCLLIQIVHSVTGLLRGEDVPSDLGIPDMRLQKGVDSDATFDAVLEWLQALPETESTASLIGDVRAHRDLGRDFPTMTYVSQLFALLRSVAARTAGVDEDAMRFVSRPRLDGLCDEVERSRTSLEQEMEAHQIAKSNPLKRVASLAETSWSRTSPPKTKKQRLSLSDDSPTDEGVSSFSPSPPPSVVTSVASEPPLRTIVTPAMLRCLTKDIRAKYGAAKPDAPSHSISP